ncbi:MAG: DnaB-like helicase C-terminal domain-containing protein [Candidatus Limiplasma sp.]|nr:DnaB-like helicase C-terminal domain-containing protein [Candidatus Limiplasma sp.]
MILMYNHDSERYLLGGLLQDPDLQRELPAYPDELMHDPQHALILATLKDMQAHKEPIELLSLSNRLKNAGNLERAGGPGYLMECLRSCPSTANVRYYTAELKRLQDTRNAYRMANEFCHRLLEGEDLTACVDDLRGKLRDANKPTGTIVHMGDVMRVAFDYIEAKARGEIIGLQTGIPDYDAFTGGLYPGELTVIGARPAVGKSAFALEIALQQGMRGKRALICSREMNDLQFGLRMTSRHTGINGMALKNGEIGDNQWEPIGLAMNELSRLPVEFSFDAPTHEQLHAVLAHEVDTLGVDLLVVDYLQLLRTMKPREKRYQEVGDVSRALKEMAMEFNIPVIALAQVGRMKEAAGGAKRAAICPVMSDLRESGNIEQDADNILFLHHPEADSDPAIPERDRVLRERIEKQGLWYTLIKIEKQRMGPTGKFALAFDKARMRFTGLERNLS